MKGRPAPLATAEEHYLFGRPLMGPYPAGLEKAKFGMIISMYYFGKLDGSAPGVDLEQLIFEEAQTMRQDVLVANGQRCGQQLQERGAVMQQLGANIQRREQAAAAAAAAAPVTPPAAVPKP